MENHCLGVVNYGLMKMTGDTSMQQKGAGKNYIKQLSLRKCSHRPLNNNYHLSIMTVVVMTIISVTIPNGHGVVDS